MYLSESELARDVILGLDLAPTMDVKLWRQAKGDVLIFWTLLSPATRETLYSDFQQRMTDSDNAEYRGMWDDAEEFSDALRPMVFLVKALLEDAEKVIRCVFPTTAEFDRTLAANPVFRIKEPIGDHFMRKYWSYGGGIVVDSADDDIPRGGIEGWNFLTYITSGIPSRSLLYKWATMKYSLK